MDNKNVITGVGGVAVVGIISYLGYKVIKQIGEIDIDWENLDDVYYNTPKDYQGSSCNDGSTKS